MPANNCDFNTIDLKQLEILGGTKTNFSTNQNIEMRSNGARGGRSPEIFSQKADIEDRKIRYDIQNLC